ncbi:MAG: ATP-binding cassette domain-containing protein, partial [Oscillospiraceae bacterium]
MLNITNLSKTFYPGTANERVAINNISLNLNSGDFVTLIGSNGAGKSTLLSLITGDHPQGYSNDLTLFGRRRGSGETI